jgi:hypothetical protein
MLYTVILVGLSPAIVAAIRRQSWASGYVALLAVGYVLIAYIGGQYLDGVPLAFDQAHIAGFIAAVVSQQAVYQLVQGTDWFKALEVAGGPAADLDPRHTGLVIDDGRTE